MHILRIANFVSPTSGGIRTALREWGRGYRSQGHEVSLIVPGPGPAVTEEDQGWVYRVPAMPVGRTGYSLIWSRTRLRHLMERIAPDTIEVSDRATLRWTGCWARRAGRGSIMVSHEHLTGIMDRRTPVPHRPAHSVADLINRRSAADYDTIACPSRFAAEEFLRIGVEAHVVPLGVDLQTFRAGPGPERTRLPGLPGSRPLHLIHCGRLSPEKNPALSIRTVRTLVDRGVGVTLTVLGHGPMRDRLITLAEGLPVTFHSYITDRAELAAVMSRADVAIAPGPVETFGLAALEAIACGVPTVCPDQGALREVVGPAGTATRSHPHAFADAVLGLRDRPAAREVARAHAERFTWAVSAQRMLTLHQQVRRA
ncbi:MAG: glycosyltransferase [Ornithinimicrobium sp.]|uniref:glycosyltransferase n=1 Tax=Ornithinimicrobium sp. TaxID=1977084 RepID=UPI003D9B37BF